MDINDHLQKLVEKGQYASKGAARRALGIPSSPADFTEGWQQRVVDGIAGRRPIALSVR